MARTKKLTDPLYSPTNPTSEVAIRAQIDDSIQEVYDQSARNDATVNLTGNQTIAGIKTFSSSPIVPTPTTSTQVATKGYVDGVAISATIPLDSLTDDYLSSATGNIKPRVATIETDLSITQTDITNLEINIDIARTAVLDTGAVNNIVVDTTGTFDLTRNGNILTVIPLFTNTSATVNISADAQTNKLIKKANDSGVMVALEVGDIKKNVPIQLIRDSVNDFFILAPKGGSNIKSIQKITITTDSSTSINQSITSVDPLKSVVFGFKKTSSGNASVDSWNFEITSNTNINVSRNTSVVTAQTLLIYVVEFNNVKSLQKGNVTFSTNTTNVAVTNVNISKSMVFVSMKTTETGSDFDSYNISPELTTNTNLLLTTNSGDSKTTKWQLIEFN